MDSPPSSGPLTSLWSVALPFLTALVGGTLALCGVLFTGAAPRQLAATDAFRSLVEALQAERAQHIVRISELEAEILRQRGTINQGIAREQALNRRIERMLEDRE